MVNLGVVEENPDQGCGLIYFAVIESVKAIA